MSCKIYLPVFFLLAYVNIAGAQELPLIHYSPNNEVNPLPSAMVTNVYQDSEGFIWMSVFSSGLIRFDGVRMDLYNQKDGLRDVGAWQMTEDGNGYLWVSTNSGLIVSEKPLTDYKYGNRVRFTSVFNGTPLFEEALSQNKIAADQMGRIWTATPRSGLIRYHILDDGSLKTDTISVALNNDLPLFVHSIISAKDSSMIAGIDGGRIIKVKNDRSGLFIDNSVNGDTQNFISLHQSSDGNYWLYGQDGDIFHYESSSNRIRQIYDGSPSTITGITSISDGTILTNSSTSGINYFDAETTEYRGSYSRENGLLSNNVFQVFRDREDNLWIAQSGGISKLRYNFKAFENFSARSVIGETPKLPSERVNTVFAGNELHNLCRAWVGTEGGASCIQENGTSRFLTQEDGLTGDWVNGILGDPYGNVWIATTRGLNGLALKNPDTIADAVNIRRLKLNNKDLYLFSVKDSPPIIAAESLSLSEPDGRRIDSAWFPGLRSMIVIVNETIYDFNPDYGLPQSLYKSVTMDGNDHVWVGTLDRGIYRSTRPVDTAFLEKMRVSGADSMLFEPVWGRDSGAPTNHIEKLTWHDGKIWVGTQEGLFTLDQQSAEILTHITQDQGLPADNAVSFAPSPVTGNLWVGTNLGLAEMDSETGSVLKTVTRQNGLIDNEVWLYGSVQVDDTGSVYYGTSAGLTIYHPEFDLPNTTEPILQLTLADLNYRAEGFNEAVFEYAALSFANVSGIRYQTRLVGYDNDWSEETTEVRLRYTNLPALFTPKEYRLEVKAVNESGVPAKEALSYSFYIEPVWWLRWWAFSVYLIMLAAGVFTVDRVQRGRLLSKERDAARLREAELQAETATARSKAAEAQANALKTENERKAIELEKAHELEIAYHELKSAQKQLIQSEKMASLGRLSTGIAHEIKNPLNFINNFAEVSAELVSELNQAIKDQDIDEIEFIMTNLSHNTLKINEHGKRADSIVKSMMQHARGGKATFEVFDINKLVNEYTDLAYHGKRAQIKDFSVSVQKKFDPSIEPIKIIGQEIGQVLLNIIGNSLDAVWEKKKKGDDKYEPEIRITTSANDRDVIIRISDNGPGVPEQIREKIFEPFFTTKPTGEGTGLGLSLSYDIITQAHNGTITLETEEEKGAEFIITLPASSGPENKKP